MDIRRNSISFSPVFSLKNGEVWVSWPGAKTATKLGNREPVVEMMRDFLAQTELGDRLAARASPE